jgi:muconolactone delta-isomerase
MAEAAEIFDELKSLRNHYPHKKLSDDEELRWAEDYILELRGYLISSIKEGFRKYRLIDDTRKFPTVGQAVAMVKAAAAARTVIGERAATRNDVWTPSCIGPGEYADMSLRDKAREQRLQAMHATVQASRFMDRSLPLSKQPERVQHFLRRAEGHRAEAMRLISCMH